MQREMAHHVLHNDRVHAEIDPALGARLHQLTIDGHALLGPDGSFPMVPWAGRIRDGRVTIDGRSVQLPVSSDGNAIHGLGRKIAWDHVGDGVYRQNLGAPWPTEGTAELRYTLLDDGIRIELDWNDGTDLPCSIGLHPWFRRQLDTGDEVVIDLAPETMVERGSDGLPTGRLVDPTPGPWDDCFRLTADPVLTWPGALSLKLSASTHWWVVFTERQNLVCVEPQTAPPDAFGHPELQPVDAWPHSMWCELRASS